MYHGDASHSGLSPSMPDVSGALKVIASIKLDGAVYASPIAVDGVIVVATENDSVYAFDTQGKQLWHVSTGSPSPAYQRPCGNIDPLGITGTPVYSAQTRDVYLAAEHGGTVGHDLIALGLHTGKIRWRQDIDLPGATPAAMQQRGALESGRASDRCRRAPLRRLRERLDLPRRPLRPHQFGARGELVRAAAQLVRADRLGPEQ
jgi:hypothetical protein